MVVAVVLTTFLLGAFYRMRWNIPKTGSPSNSSVAAAPAAPTDGNAEPAIDESQPASKPAPILVLSDIEYSSGPNSSTITVDVDEQVHYQINRLTNPDRIYLDLQGSRIDPVLSRKKFEVIDPVLKAIRVAEHKGNVTRVTLETKRFCDYLLTTVRESHQLQIQITQSGWAELSSRNNQEPAISAAAR
jgi:hypothetical protein